MPKRPRFVGCTIKRLPDDLHGHAAASAARINPVNRPTLSLPAAKIVALTTKYWGPKGVHLTVAFMETTTRALADKIIGYMNKWGTRCNATFAYTQDRSSAQVRVSRAPGGYWSYLGTDILHAPQNEQTMNLEGFVLATPDSEYDRVVCHETGHTLGFPHEHMRPELVALLDPAKTIAYFGRTQGWSAQEVQQQVLTPLDVRSIMQDPPPPKPDQDSIMCYQLPGAITKSGQPIRGGTLINETDFGYAATIYPKEIAPPPPPPPPPTSTFRYTLESAAPIVFTKQ